MPLILCAKGIEEGSGLTDARCRRARSARPAPIAVLSGPTFAHEVAAGLPTAVTLACEDEALGERLRARLARPAFRLYLSDDVAGAEIGGAVKNVLAIACGVVEGRGLGQNARAALIARGFAEMTRFGLAMGARRETLAGLSRARRPRADLLVDQLAATSRSARRIGEGRDAADAAGRPPHRRRRRAHRAGAPPHRAERRASTCRSSRRSTPCSRARCRSTQVLEQLMARPPRPEAH